VSEARSFKPFPDVIGHYQLIEPIGSGGFSDVFRAESGSGKRVALKLFRNELADSIDLERYRREVQTLRIEHPNIIRYLDSGEVTIAGEQRHWLVMEYVEGETLKKQLKAVGGKLSPVRARAIARQVALGLEALHAEGVVHRDLKPGNIHLGSDDVVRLLDFGVVSLLDTTTITLIPPGTLAYAAPEQLRAESCVSIDLYALGVVLYEMLAGRRPFRGTDAEVYGAILQEEPEPVRAHNPEVPFELDALVMRLLEKEPIKRPASAREVAEALRPQIAVAEPGAAPRRYDRSLEPRVYARVGVRDVGAFAQACLRSAEPTGVVVGVTEKYAIAAARRATNSTNIEFLVDPLVPRMGFLGFTRTKTLREMTYSPDGIEPFQAADFKSQADAKEFVRKVLAEQDMRGVSRLYAPALAIRGSDDRTISTNAKLIDFAVTESAVYHKKVIAQVPLNLEAVATESARIELVNRLRRADPDEWWLMLNPLRPGSDIGELAAALRFALLLQETGSRSVITRAGILRHLFLAFGVGGVEVGLGRLNGFRFSHWEQEGGPGYVPPLFEFGSLLSALPQDLTRAILAAGVLPETECPCRSCRDAASIEERTSPAATAEHNAYVLHEERLELAGVAPAMRVSRLRERVDGALAWEKRLRHEKIVTGEAFKHLRVWIELMDLVGEELLESDQLRRRQAS
jgi:serine/threonine-protein kinase